MNPDFKGYLIPLERIENAIVELRGECVVFSSALATLCGIPALRAECTEGKTKAGCR